MARLSSQDLRDFRQRMPQFMAAFDAMGAALFTEGSLDTVLREMLRLKSAQIAGCQH